MSNPEAIRDEVNRLLQLARDRDHDLGAINWGNLSVRDIERRQSVLYPNDAETIVVMIEEASPSCRLPGFLAAAWDAAKFGVVFFECEW